MRQLGEDMNQCAMWQVFCWSARVMCLVQKRETSADFPQILASFRFRYYNAGDKCSHFVPPSPYREDIFMTTTSPLLKIVYEGWDSHQQALMRAVTPLTSEQLAWRPAPNQSSVNDLIGHIAGARLWWFYKMSAPGSAALARQIAPGASEKFNAGDINELNRWIEANMQWEETLTKTPGELLKWVGVELADD